MNSTTDIWFIVFLRKMGLKISRFEKDQRQIIRAFFEVNDNDWATLKLAYLQSDLQEIRKIMDNIKELAK